MKKYIAPAARFVKLNTESMIAMSFNYEEGGDEATNRRRGGGSAIWSSDTEDSSKPFNRK